MLLGRLLEANLKPDLSGDTLVACSGLQRIPCIGHVLIPVNQWAHADVPKETFLVRAVVYRNVDLGMLPKYVTDYTRTQSILLQTKLARLVVEFFHFA